MKQKMLLVLLCLLLIFQLSILTIAAEGNMDGSGGGNLEGTTGDSGWNDGNEGVRVSVVKKDTKQVVGNIFDWTNIIPPPGVVAFAKRNKLQYLSGSSLSPTVGAYLYHNPGIALPNVISVDSSNNIAGLKAYFTDETIVKTISEHASIDYETLISGEFTILIEPLAIIKYHGTRYALTATEAALYDRLTSGGLRSAVGYLSHQNMPLAMYLEVSEFGIPAVGGSGMQSNESILQHLGVGTVNFGELPVETTPPAAPTTYDYEFRADTDVIVSILVETESEINPDAPGKATFSFPDRTVIKEYVIPEDESQLVWAKWRTPSVDVVTNYEVPVAVSSGSGGGMLRIKVTPIKENTPPNPEGRDRNDGFVLRSSPVEAAIGSLAWGEWLAEWEENWEWESNRVRVSGSCTSSCSDTCNDAHWTYEDQGEWVDNGEWAFEWEAYTATLDVTAKTAPDERVPTARGDEIKSGYGINADVEVRMVSNGGSGNTSEVQHIIAVFPEFEYETFNRWLIPEGGSPGYLKKWGFKPNVYSQFNNAVHFSPIWYPDASAYPVSFTVLDAWTPAGQLYCVLTASDVSVNGNVYQDWHVAPGFVGR